MTEEQAEKAYDEAEPVPLSEERIKEIVDYATTPEVVWVTVHVYRPCVSTRHQGPRGGYRADVDAEGFDIPLYVSAEYHGRGAKAAAEVDAVRWAVARGYRVRREGR